jgi:hypothetical protein
VPNCGTEGLRISTTTEYRISKVHPLIRNSVTLAFALAVREWRLPLVYIVLIGFFKLSLKALRGARTRTTS